MAVKAADDVAPSSSDGPIPTQPAPTTGASGAPITADGAFRISTSDDVRVVVTVVEDMACPACKAFEAAYGDTLAELAALPGAAVDYRVISFLDRMSDDQYSSRAANASYCVWNRPGDDRARQDTWRRFQVAAFRAQPAEGGPGLSDDRLAAMAKTAGAGDVSTCITTRQYAQDVHGTTSSTMSEPEFEGTPTLLVNGERLDLRSAATLLDKVKGLLPG
ncbi:DSBA oxidoreductase [Gordonia neofelifaecis NRRL B-59395]|uniref:DSBA oxidoreductase n=1 Tax=Gordonia neofelifaecis NRRL B-59395 TaxID=644548 RepID=F1YPJ7_9ACTN|nr:DSBA oxidoreductase [Gordonia neofelifaecis NRRL B-59395]